MENTDPRIFTNVRVFAGDKFKKTADASYKNFDAGQNFNIGSNIQKNKKIGTIESWGPLFRVSLDLIIHSRHRNENYERSSVLDFFNAAPSIYLDKTGFVTTVDKKIFHFDIELNHWYNIVIEQKSLNGKVITLYNNNNKHNNYDFFWLCMLSQLMGN